MEGERHTHNKKAENLRQIAMMSNKTSYLCYFADEIDRLQDELDKAHCEIQRLKAEAAGYDFMDQ